MKKDNWILMIAVALYSFLFYKQTAGLNFTLFTLMLLIASLIRDPQLIKYTSWKLAALGSLISAACIGYYGNGLSVTANVIPLSLLSAVSYSTTTSVLASLLFSFYSYTSAIVLMFVDWQERKSKQLVSKLKIKGTLIFIPVMITFLFFLMYRSSNVLFNDFTKNFHLNFISWSWILFTLGGFVVLYGFFYHQQIQMLAEQDRSMPNEIDPSAVKNFMLFGKLVSNQDEELSGKLLFLLLNALLLLVNGIDFRFIFINNALPEGITHSEFVHQGTGMLIISLLLAIAIILSYFRGSLNFSEKGKIIKILVYVWIIQNAFMILSTAFRNNLYIMEYGLTYKRIGVYIYLFLTLIGLITTAIKIMHFKTNAYLFRVNGWVFYIVLIMSTVVNWDKYIADFNIHKAKQIQMDYLASLSFDILPQLYNHHHSTLNKNATSIISAYSKSDTERDRQFYHFLTAYNDRSWKSWYYNSEQTYCDLLTMHTNQKITSLNLSLLHITSMAFLKKFDQLLQLNLTYNELMDIKELSRFKELNYLNITHNRLISLNGIAALKKLEYLDISQNPITDYTGLYNLKTLKKLYVGSSITNFQFESLQNHLKNTIIAKK